MRGVLTELWGFKSGSTEEKNGYECYSQCLGCKPEYMGGREPTTARLRQDRTREWENGERRRGRKESEDEGEGREERRSRGRGWGGVGGGEQRVVMYSQTKGISNFFLQR